MILWNFDFEDAVLKWVTGDGQDCEQWAMKAGMVVLDHKSGSGFFDFMATARVERDEDDITAVNVHLRSFRYSSKSSSSSW